ncbi:MAG: hypothetical protein Q9175_004876 [Cornicularia normoerica]
MQLHQKSQPCSKTVFVISVLLVSRVAAQDLGVKLPGASSTSETSSTTASSSTTEPSSTTSTTSSASSSTSASSANGAALTGLPKLAQDNYPAPTVPPTADAPFMQKSSLPDGTVFICVGAALGFIGVLVLAWRGLVAWSLHRSVKRAAIAQSSKYSRVGDPRANNGKSTGPYFSPGPGPTMSLDHLAASGKAGGKTPSSAHGSLFFSPTAGTGMQTPGNRGSSYLPAGYYAAGNSAPGGGSGMTHVGGGGIGLSNLAPQNHRYSRARSTGPSPPGSPSLPPSRGADSTLARLSTAGLTMHASNSNLNLSAPPQGRAPSAYLEDLFENHPPGTPPPEEYGRGRRF